MGLKSRFMFPAALAALALALLVLPIPAPCALRYVLGVPCPTCGMTRAARLVLAGDLVGATHMHPLWWVFLPGLVFLGGAELVGYLRTGKLGFVTDRVWFKWFGGFAIAALMLVWIARFFGAFGGPVPV